ncbi:MULTISPECIES: EutP/PduV family microcompartment system protein [Tepidanaerobacter]|uniref:EutP/PduV family microcompartment system protein n=1 Tax=Tepidanaerobacter TaxID=499228 RepID=UPI000A838F37|nr:MULTISPECIES: EutP/PduV family microcompartment system protein [Tepidanaerobacter]
MQKKIMFIGASGSGKSTLIKTLRGCGEAVKTQAVTFEDGYIDIPGEYMDIRRLNYAVITTAMDADAIFVVQDSTSSKPTTPPGFAGMFNIPVYGVISKIDLPTADIKRASKYLEMCGVKGKYYPVSAVTGEGIEELRELIENL